MIFQANFNTSQKLKICTFIKVEKKSWLPNLNMCRLLKVLMSLHAGVRLPSVAHAHP